MNIIISDCILVNFSAAFFHPAQSIFKNLFIVVIKGYLNQFSRSEMNQFKSSIALKEFLLYLC